MGQGSRAAGGSTAAGASPSTAAQKSPGVKAEEATHARAVRKTERARSDAAAIRGFRAERATQQRELEARLQRLPSPESAEAHLRFLTSEPHLAGTPGSKRVAEYFRDQLRSYGFEAELVRYDVWLPHPKEVKLEVVAPERIELARPEEAIAGDPSSGDARAVAGFNAFSPSGEVIAPVVYANYGLPEDYAKLAEQGISVEGRIVLVRYGRTFRGVKTFVAEENKAAGVIIYSDPADDGYVMGDPYPRGPWRPMSGIQRGSVYYGFLAPGDPLTPGLAATPHAKRIAPEQARTLPRIPTMPISARDAEEILKRLHGPRVPRAWQGGLPHTYHYGAGNVRVRMKLEMDYQRRPVWNAVGMLRGQLDEWVIIGNHHDAWVFGAVDPSSGTAAVLEMARALGTLKREGWKPRRSILVCAWDAEEFGLIGSTEWVEHRLEELQQKAVAYINVDSAVSGDRFGGSGTPSLKRLLREATREVHDPRTQRTVFDLWRERNERGAERGRRSAAGSDLEEAQTPVGNLGSGSDFTPFFHHAGVPSIDLGFGGEYGVYHSIYDSFAWMKQFGDPDFAYHATAARLAGILVLRLTEADVLPFDYEAYSAEIATYLNDLESILRGRRPPQGQPGLELNAVSEAVAALRAAAAGVAAEGRAAQAAGDAGRIARVNAALREAEQMLLAPGGLAGRPWYRHTVFAPGTYQGYGVVLLPGVREALERGDWPIARAEAQVLSQALHRAAARLNEVTVAEPE